MPNGPKKIAILGGGMGGLTAAFELTSRPGWKDRYDVTVFQEGWRLGGKGASGRNSEASQRIEEHGLHILLGFYENAFQVLRRCYQELGRRPGAPLSTWRDAFAPHLLIVLTERVNEQWVDWSMEFPTNDDVPGDGGEPPSAWGFVRRILGWLAEVVDASPHLPTAPRDVGVFERVLADLAPLRADVEDLRTAAMDEAPSRPSWGNAISFLSRSIEGAVRSIESAVAHGAVSAEGAFLRLAHKLADSLPADPKSHSRADHGTLLFLLRAFKKWLWSIVGAPVTASTELRRLWILSDLSITTVIGMIEDGLVFDETEYFSIDALDFRDWLGKHGAETITITSAPVTALYDLGFSLDAGVGAGTMIHGAMRMLLTYKGAVMWKMQAGMGETVFAPLYLVLARRGVKFEYFHRVDALRLGPAGTTIDVIEMGRQATPRGGRYDPLVDVNGLPCWPSRPRFEQLEEGEKLRTSGEDLEDWWTRWPDAGRVTLERGVDFDEIVLAISLAGVKPIAQDLAAASPRFRDMLDKVQTCATQGVQLWFEPDLATMGSPYRAPVLGSYEEPYDTWADMTHLLKVEGWSDATRPGSLAYLCNELEDAEPLPPRDDHDFPKRQYARMAAQARRFLRSNVRHLWPRATTTNDPDELIWDWLVDPKGRTGEARLDAQWLRAPLGPSERYVLSAPGSVQYRMPTHGTAFANLYLAGDWILTSMSAGCLEAATMGGMHAARAISGFPEAIVGDWTSDEHGLEGVVR